MENCILLDINICKPRNPRKLKSTVYIGKNKLIFNEMRSALY
jgi:hypothetical protein